MKGTRTASGRRGTRCATMHCQSSGLPDDLLSEARGEYNEKGKKGLQGRNRSSWRGGVRRFSILSGYVTI